MAKSKENKAVETPVVAPAGLPAGFAVVRQVTASVWKWDTNEPRYVRFETAIAEGKARIRAAKSDSKEPMKPASVAQVTNLLDNKRYTLVIGEVLKGDLTENYPADGYVGKSFAIAKSDIPGKRYKGYTVQEIAPATA